MKQAVDWIKGALAKKDLVLHFTHYYVQDETIRAYDGRMLACHPFPHPETFLIPGAEFEAVLDRMPVDCPSIELLPEKQCIRMKQGRFRGDIAMLPEAEFPDLPLGDDWKPVPEDLVPVMKSLRPFISDNATKPWALSVAILDGLAYATNNVSMAAGDVPGTEGMSALIPSWAVDFILDRMDGLAEWQVTSNYVAFRWTNGAWMRTQLIDDEFPEIAVKLIAEMGDPDWEITREWREAYETVTGVAKNTLEVYADRIVGKTDKSEIDFAVEAPAPEKPKFEGDEPHSIWTVKFLAKVMEVATHWQPAVWPEPAPFKGDHVRGLIVGRH